MALDNFNRADGGVGANWTTHTAGGASGALQISGNKVGGQNDGNYRFNTYNAFSPGNDQKCYITFDSEASVGGTANWVFNVAVRCNGSVGSLGGYIVQFNRAGNARIIELNSDAETELVGATAYGGYTGGDIFEVRVSGTTISGHKNGGAAIVSTTDSTHASGIGGLGIYENDVQLFLDNYNIETIAAAGRGQAIGGASIRSPFEGKGL